MNDVDNASIAVGVLTVVVFKMSFFRSDEFLSSKKLD